MDYSSLVDASLENKMQSWLHIQSEQKRFIAEKRKDFSLPCCSINTQSISPHKSESRLLEIGN